MTATIAVDFDGTVVTHDYPDIGEELPHAAETLRDLYRQGHRLILYTMRSGAELAEAERWFRARSIPLYGVNKNPDQASWTSSPKVYANLYIDDAALGAPVRVPTAGDRPRVDWLLVRAMLAREGLL